MAGRPSFQATSEERAQVEALSAYGIDQKAICDFILRPRVRAGGMAPISLATLRKHFRRELDSGEPKLIAKVADALAKTALDRSHRGHVAAAIFILKVRAGWKEGQILHHEGSVGLELDLGGATDEELAVIEKFLKRKAADASPRPANDQQAA